MNWLKLGKVMITFVTSAGVGAVVGNAVKSVTPSSLNTLNKVLVGIGGLVITGMIVDQSTKYVEQQIDELLSLGSNKEDEDPKIIISSDSQIKVVSL